MHQKDEEMKQLYKERTSHENKTRFLESELQKLNKTLNDVRHEREKMHTDIEDTLHALQSSRENVLIFYFYSYGIKFFCSKESLKKKEGN